MLEKLTSPYKEFGVLGGTIYLVDRLLGAVSSGTGAYFYELMVQPIPDGEIIPARFMKNLEFREIARGDPDIETMPARPEIKDDRFDQGAICLGMYKKSALIGYIWFATGEYLEDEVRCTFELEPVESSVFDFDLYIFPEHRLGFAFVSLWEGANRFLRQRGIAYTFSRLNRFNVASRRAHDRLGWQLVGKAVIFKLWRLEVMAASLAPYVYLSWSQENRARIKMRPDALNETS